MADYLVEHCAVPFRETHFISGKAVARAEIMGIDVSEMSFEELQKIDDRIKEDVMPFLALRHSMNARTSEGGTSTARTLEQVELFQDYIKGLNL